MRLTAFYDLEFGPVSYDFITWLVRAMVERDRRDCDGLHVVVVPKEDGLGGFARHWGSHDAEAARWRLWHIVIAACPLAGATVTLAASRHQAQSMNDGHSPTWWPDGKAHFAGPLIAAARDGWRIPRLQATAQARRYVAGCYRQQKIVTVTIRQQSTDGARNTNTAAAGAFMTWLRARGYHPIGIPDTHQALMLGGDPRAALDIDLRLALYERAAMNVVGNNGPAMLLWHSDAGFLMFNAGLPAADWREHWAKHLALKTGDQLPWARPGQRLIYDVDAIDVLQREFAKWEAGHGVG